MSDDKVYKDGDIVWVKLGNNWWPGEVTGGHRQPAGLVKHLKRKPYCVVKFFQEDAYEYVKSAKQIFPFQCSKKAEFIRKGTALFKAKNKFMEKFPSDVETAERLTRRTNDSNSDMVFLNNPESIVKAILGEASLTSHRFGHDYYDSDDEYNRSSQSANKRRSGDSVTKILNITPQRTITATATTQSTTTSETPQRSGYTMPRSSWSNSADSNVYRCTLCEYTTQRQNVLILHRRTHSGSDNKTTPTTATATTVKPSTTTAASTTRSSTTASKITKSLEASTNRVREIHKTTRVSPCVSPAKRAATPLPAAKTLTPTPTVISQEATLSAPPVAVKSPHKLNVRNDDDNVGRQLSPATSEVLAATSIPTASGKKTKKRSSQSRKLRSKLQITADIADITFPSNHHEEVATLDDENNSDVSSNKTEITVVHSVAEARVPNWRQVKSPVTPMPPPHKGEEIRQRLLADWSDEEKEEDDEQQEEEEQQVQKEKKGKQQSSVEEQNDTAESSNEAEQQQRRIGEKPPEELEVKQEVLTPTPLTAGNRIRNIPKKDRRDVVLKDFNNDFAQNHSTPQSDSTNSNSNSSDSVVLVSVMSAEEHKQEINEEQDSVAAVDKNEELLVVRPKEEAKLDMPIEEENMEVKAGENEQPIREELTKENEESAAEIEEEEKQPEKEARTELLEECPEEQIDKVSIAELEAVQPDQMIEKTPVIELEKAVAPLLESTQPAEEAITLEEAAPEANVLESINNEKAIVTEIIEIVTPLPQPPVPEHEILSIEAEPSITRRESLTSNSELPPRKLSIARDLSHFDYHDEDEDETENDKLQSIAQFKKKYNSPDKTHGGDHHDQKSPYGIRTRRSHVPTPDVVEPLTSVVNESEQKNQELAANIETLLAETAALPAAISGIKEEVQVNDLPLKVRSKRFFKSRNDKPTAKQEPNNTAPPNGEWGMKQPPQQQGEGGSSNNGLMSEKAKVRNNSGGEVKKSKAERERQLKETREGNEISQREEMLEEIPQVRESVEQMPNEVDQIRAEIEANLTKTLQPHFEGAVDNQGSIEEGLKSTHNEMKSVERELAAENLQEWTEVETPLVREAVTEPVTQELDSSLARPLPLLVADDRQAEISHHLPTAAEMGSFLAVNEADTYQELPPPVVESVTTLLPVDHQAINENNGQNFDPPLDAITMPLTVDTDIALRSIKENHIPQLGSGGSGGPSSHLSNSSVGTSDAGAECGSSASMHDDERFSLSPHNLLTPIEGLMEAAGGEQEKEKCEEERKKAAVEDILNVERLVGEPVKMLRLKETALIERLSPESPLEEDDDEIESPPHEALSGNELEAEWKKASNKTKLIKRPTAAGVNKRKSKEKEKEKGKELIKAPSKAAKRKLSMAKDKEPIDQKPISPVFERENHDKEQPMSEEISEAPQTRRLTRSSVQHFDQHLTVKDGNLPKKNESATSPKAAVRRSSRNTRRSTLSLEEDNFEQWEETETKATELEREEKVEEPLSGQNEQKEQEKAKEPEQTKAMSTGEPQKSEFVATIGEEINAQMSEVMAAEPVQRKRWRNRKTTPRRDVAALLKNASESETQTSRLLAQAEKPKEMEKEKIQEPEIEQSLTSIKEDSRSPRKFPKIKVTPPVESLMIRTRRKTMDASIMQSTGHEMEAISMMVTMPNQLKSPGETILSPVNSAISDIRRFRRRKTMAADFNPLNNDLELLLSSSTPLPAKRKKSESDVVSPTPNANANGARPLTSSEPYQNPDNVIHSSPPPKVCFNVDDKHPLSKQLANYRSGGELSEVEEYLPQFKIPKSSNEPESGFPLKLDKVDDKLAHMKSRYPQVDITRKEKPHTPPPPVEAAEEAAIVDMGSISLVLDKSDQISPNHRQLVINSSAGTAAAAASVAMLQQHQQIMRRSLESPPLAAHNTTKTSKRPRKRSANQLQTVVPPSVGGNNTLIIIKTPLPPASGSQDLPQIPAAPELLPPSSFVSAVGTFNLGPQVTLSALNEAPVTTKAKQKSTPLSGGSRKQHTGGNKITIPRPPPPPLPVNDELELNSAPASEATLIEPRLLVNPPLPQLQRCPPVRTNIKQPSRQMTSKVHTTTLISQPPRQMPPRRQTASTADAPVGPPSIDYNTLPRRMSYTDVSGNAKMPKLSAMSGNGANGSITEDTPPALPPLHQLPNRNARNRTSTNLMTPQPLPQQEQPQEQQELQELPIEAVDSRQVLMAEPQTAPPSPPPPPLTSQLSEATTLMSGGMPTLQPLPLVPAATPSPLAPAANDEQSQNIIAVPLAEFANIFVLCRKEGDHYKPAHTRPHYLVPEHNTLIPLPLEEMENLNLTGEMLVVQPPGLSGGDDNNIKRNAETESSSNGPLVYLQPEDVVDTTTDATDVALAAEAAVTAAAPTFIEESPEEHGPVNANAVMLNIEGQEILLDSATFAELLTNPDANTRLRTEDGTEFELSREVLNALMQQHMAQELQQATAGPTDPTHPDIIAAALAGSELYSNEALEIETSHWPPTAAAAVTGEGGGGLIFHSPKPPQHLTPPIKAPVSETNALLDQTPIMSPLEKPSLAMSKGHKMAAELSTNALLACAGGVGGNDETTGRLNLDDSLAVIGVSTQASTVPPSLELPITVTNPAIAPKGPNLALAPAKMSRAPIFNDTGS